MMYFATQEDAQELFQKIIPVAESHSIVFILVRNQKDANNLITDLETLLCRFPMVRKQDGFRIRGNKQRSSQTIKVIVNEPEKTKGIPENQIVYA